MATRSPSPLVGRPITSIHNLPPFTLRHLDNSECAVLGLTPRRAVALSIENSDGAFAVECPEGLLAVWGFRRGPDNTSNADLWLLTTPLVNQYPVAFVREGYRIIAALHTEFPILLVEVWPLYLQALAWLNRLGFRPTTNMLRNGFLQLERHSQWVF